MRRFVRARFFVYAALRRFASFFARFSELALARCAEDVAVLIFLECETTARLSCARRSLLLFGVALSCVRERFCDSCAFFASRRRSSSMFRCLIMDVGSGVGEMPTIFCKLCLDIIHKIVFACLQSEPIPNCGNPQRNAHAPSQRCVNTAHGKCSGR